MSRYAPPVEHGGPILEIGAVLLAAALAGWLARRLGLPAVIGYLVVGVAVSPFTPGYVADRAQIQLLADLGVVLLLFEVGIELDLARLRREHGGLLVAAPLQLAVTTVIGGAVLAALGIALPVALVMGLAIAMSSSVVIVNITRSARRRTDHDTEGSLLGWSLVQDLVGVLASALLLAVAGLGGGDPVDSIVRLVAFAALAWLAARVMPRVIRLLAPYPDLFVIVAIAAGLAGAGVGSVIFHVPLALAAFIAGLMITESPEAARVRERLLPFRDVFAVMFFVAIGTLIDPAALTSGLGWLALLALLLVVGKVLPGWLLGRLTGIRRPGQVAVGIAQVGEFSFVLGSLLFAEGLIGDDLHAALLAIVALSIGVSAVAVRLPVRGWTRGEAPAT